MTELNECDRHTKGLLCHRLSSALLIRINLAWLKMQMAQRHWWSLHVFITFNWFNYMENEMVGCVIKCPPPLHPHPPVSRDREMTILSCQEDKVMRLAALPLALSLFPSLPLRGHRCGFPKQGETFFFFYCDCSEHFGLGLRSTYSIVWAESLAKI